MAGEELSAKLAEIDGLRAAENSAALARFLGSEEPKPVRLAAVQALAEIGDAPALTALGEILKDDEDPLVEETLHLLGDMKSDEALLALGKALSSGNVFLRSRTIKAIAAHRSPSALSFLVRAARDGAPQVARMGRRALTARVQEAPDDLAKLRPETLAGVMAELSFEVVRDFLPGDMPAAIRGAAIARLADCTEPEAVEFLVAACVSGNESAPAALDAIEKNPHVPAEGVRRVLKEGPANLRARAFVCYARRCGPEGAETLAAGLRDAESAVRREAVLGLFRVRGQKALSLIAQLLGDDAPEVCLAVLDCLAGLPAQAVGKHLTLAALMGAPEVAHRALLLAAAKQVAGPQLVPGYLEFLKEALADVRPSGQVLEDICNAITALAKTPPPEASQLLVKAALSASPRLRRTAMAALERYPKGPRMMAYLGLVEAGDLDVLETVGFALSEIKSPQAIIPLIRVQAGTHLEAAQRARKYLDALPELRDVQELLRLLRCKHVPVKRYAAKKLSELGQPHEIPADDAAAEAEAGAEKKAASGAGSAGGKLTEEAANSDEIFKLIGMLRSADANVKRLAVQRLSQMRDRRALEALLQAAEDEDVEVQLSVVEALQNFLEDEAVLKRVMAFVDYGDVAVRMMAVQILGDGKVVAAVDRLIAAMSNVFLRSYAEEALRKIGDRRGYLAVLRRKKREQLFPKKAKLERAKLDKLRARRGRKGK